MPLRRAAGFHEAARAACEPAPATCCRDCRSSAKPARQRRANGRAPKLNVRPWRDVEQQALIDLYDRYARGVYGAPRRDAAYWEWLLVRRGYDQILVAAHAAADSSESFVASCKSIVGYAFVRGSDVVELVVSPEWPQAPGHLLRRVASDALERDERAVRLFHPALPDSIWNPPPPNATCGEDLRPASSHQPRQFVKVLDPVGFLQCSAGALASRARHNGDGSCLNLRLDRRRIRVEVHADHVHLTDARPSRQEVRLRSRCLGAAVGLLAARPGCRRRVRPLARRCDPRTGAAPVSTPTALAVNAR